MPGTIPAPVGDDNYQGEYDAETLVRAAEIISNPERLNKAKTAAQNMATEKIEAFRNLMNISGQTFNQTFNGFEVS